MNSFSQWPSACDVRRPYAPQTIKWRYTHICTHCLPEFGYIWGGAGGGIVIVNYCIFLSRDGERQLLGVPVVVEGEVRSLWRGEGRAASLCSEMRTQRDPMNIWFLAADCVWALNTHNVSFGRHLTSVAWQWWETPTVLQSHPWQFSYFIKCDAATF